DVDLAAVAQDAIDLYGPVAEERGCKVVPVLIPAPMKGSRPLLLHMAANLIDNAIKHSPPGGSIIVATSRDGAATRFSVADGGPGIPGRSRAWALRRFGRLDESRATPGSGLGLTLVQTVARVHRGHLSLSDNAPGLLAEVAFDTRPSLEGRVGAGRPT
ncbi:MAG TPA: sensor histidine kinase, partial [bacterium]